MAREFEQFDLPRLSSEYYDLASLIAHKPIDRGFLRIKDIRKDPAGDWIQWDITQPREKTLSGLEVLAILRDIGDFRGRDDDGSTTNRGKVARLGGFATRHIDIMAERKKRIFSPRALHGIHSALVVVQNGLVNSMEHPEYANELAHKELDILSVADWILGIER